MTPKALTAAALLLFSLARAYSGQLVNQYVPNDDGVYGLSWWMSANGPMSVEWKKKYIGLENTVLEVVDVDADSSRLIKDAVNATGYFEFDVAEGTMILVKPLHPAYNWNWALIESDSYFLVDPKQGIRRNMLKMPSLKINANKLSSPYPNPKQFSVWQFVKNPIVIMGGGMLLVSYGLPALTQGMDLSQMQLDGQSQENQFKGTFLSSLG